MVVWNSSRINSGTTVIEASWALRETNTKYYRIKLGTGIGISILCRLLAGMRHESHNINKRKDSSGSIALSVSQVMDLDDYIHNNQSCHDHNDGGFRPSKTSHDHFNFV